MACQKHDRSTGSKDKILGKKKGANNQIGIIKKENEEINITDYKTPKEVQVPENSKNEEILINYISSKKRWNRNEIIIDNIFSYNISLDIINENENLEPKSVEECQCMNEKKQSRHN
jgi:hypothetical protein